MGAEGKEPRAKDNKVLSRVDGEAAQTEAEGTRTDRLGGEEAGPDSEQTRTDFERTCTDKGGVVDGEPGRTHWDLMQPGLGARRARRRSESSEGVGSTRVVSPRAAPPRSSSPLNSLGRRTISLYRA